MTGGLASIVPRQSHAPVGGLQVVAASELAQVVALAKPEHASASTATKAQRASSQNVMPAVMGMVTAS